MENKKYSCYRCKKLGREYMLEYSSFNKDKSRRSGTTSKCKLCFKETSKETQLKFKQNSYTKLQDNRRKRDIRPIQRIKHNLRNRIRDIFNGKTKSISAISSLGCTYSTFIKYIISKFKPGMSLDNYGLWHIDHIKPLASFNLNNPIDVAKASHYSNLQPLWAKENLSKGKSIF